MHKIAIIGGGPTAVYTAKYLCSLAPQVDVTIFEAQAEAGKGTAYHQDWNEGELLANIASIEIPPICESLEQWLLSFGDDELADMGMVRSEINDRAFFPRVTLGKYFQAQLAGLVQHYKGRLHVKTQHKVLDVALQDAEIVVTVKSGARIIESGFDYVVMATGHAWPKNTEIRPGYFLSPWPSSALGTIGNVHVGIRGTSLSAIDSMVTLAMARGSFYRDAQDVLVYAPEPDTEGFRLTMISRKGLLPEADFYHPIPYTPLAICTKEAVDKLIASAPRETLLGHVFALFKEELIACDSDYAEKLGMHDMSVEEFAEAYFHERETHDPFAWAARNLKEAKENQAALYTVPWRYAILRMHEVVARIVPHLLEADYQRFHGSFKHIFVDDYATVPHESIERVLAMHAAGKLDIMRVGEDYALHTEVPAGGALLVRGDERIHFPAFIEAMGQRTLSPHEFPFPSLWKQGLLKKATVPHFLNAPRHQRKQIGGIDLDLDYHPVSDSPHASRLYCLSLPFMLGQFPFVQGITSSHDMGKKVAKNIAQELAGNNDIEPVEQMVYAL